MGSPGFSGSPDSADHPREISPVKETTWPSHFKIKCEGLMPYTKHNFFYDGVDKTSVCVQISDPKRYYKTVEAKVDPGVLPGPQGSGIYSDDKGQCVFRVLFDDLQPSVAAGKEKLSNKKFTLKATYSYASLNTDVEAKVEWKQAAAQGGRQLKQVINERGQTILVPVNPTGYQGP